MDKKKWTDADLKTAFEDSCKFANLDDLKDFLLKRRQLAASTESKLDKHDVIVSLLADEEIDKLIDSEIVDNEYYQKFSEREQAIAKAAMKAGAKWFKAEVTITTT